MRWLRALAQPFTYLGGVILAFILFALVLVVQHEERGAYEAALAKGDADARVFEEYIARTLRGADDMLLLLRKLHLQDPARFDLDSWTREFTANRQIKLHFALAGADGIVKASTLGRAGLDVSGSENFRAVAALTEDKLLIGRPLRLAGTDGWAMILSRRITAPDGSFAGHIAALLDPQELETFYRSINLGADGIVSLIGTDGFIRARGSARGSAPVETLGQSIDGAEMLRRYREAPNGSYWKAPGRVDPVPRLITYRAMQDFPLFAVVGRSKADVFQGASQNTRIYYGIALFMALGVALSVAAAANRQLTILSAQRKLETTNLRFDTALENIAHGLCMFDAKGRITVVNQQYRDMYRLSADVARPGCTLDALLRHRQEAGLLAGDPQEHGRRIRANVASGRDAEWRIEQADGRVISVLDRPIPRGGWITIHRDVTAEVKAATELAETQNFLKTVIEHVPSAIIVKNAQDFRYVLVNRAGEAFIGRPSEALIGKTVHEIHAKPQADKLHAFDCQLLAAGRQRMDDIQPLHEAGNGATHVAVDRVVVHGADGHAKYLLGVVIDITERKRNEAQIYHLAHHDALTGLANRALFLKSVDEALARVRRHGDRFNILVLDLDQFKGVNDTLGHPVGDALLQRAAVRLRECMCETDIVARLGGDEFAILQRAEDAQDESALGLARRLLAALREPYDLAGSRLVVGTSIGIALAPRDGDNADQLLKNADLALYRAKAEGRNRCRLFDREMEAEVQSRHALETDLRDALRRDEFVLHYQTVVASATREVCGVEALVRWRHPERGLLAPDSFIPLAEETGLIDALGEWILQRACADAAAMPPHIKVAVNLSASQFTNPELRDMVSAVLAETGLAPHRLELEITETVLLQHNATNLAMLHALRDLGIAIVLDDFGTGYSSLSYLQMFPFDKIKIDRSFVSELSSRADSAAIVSAVNGLGKNLSILTTAEGVETEEQFQLLRASGIDQMQGYLFSRPRPQAELSFAPAEAAA